MKKLLNTLYITSADSYLSLDGETVVVLNQDKVLGRIPLHNLEGIVAFGYTGASPALMGECANRNISLCFLNPNGRFLARVTGKVYGNVTLRKEQYRISDDPELSCRIAKNFIIGKVFNARWVIERATREHSLSVDCEKLKKVSSKLQNFLELIRECSSTEQLRGYEGEAASLYFSVFDDLILQQKEYFYFRGRNKRPPMDRVNALLSFVYTLLANNTASALETVGLDPYVGFLHTDRPGRISLALDLMEELRPVMADRFVLSLINKRIINGDGFIIRENGSVEMTDETRKTVLTQWQNRKQEKIIHPFLEEKLEWGLVPYAQALLLARTIRSDIDEYPPFLWK
ncbi:MAG: type I-C CRISPR-associated endonuclease Cas1 [Clostridiaceae bacterium]|nr:type I-C CRISPR-associated endonuclease Cas1 [Clostridiaceae bacterium]